MIKYYDSKLSKKSQIGKLHTSRLTQTIINGSQQRPTATYLSSVRGSSNCCGSESAIESVRRPYVSEALAAMAAVIALGGNSCIETTNISTQNISVCRRLVFDKSTENVVNVACHIGYTTLLCSGSTIVRSFRRYSCSVVLL